MLLKKVLSFTCLCFLFHQVSAECLFDPSEVTVFCSEENDWGISYPAKTEDALAFSNALGCFRTNSAKSGGWFIMQIDDPGDLAITLSHSEDSDLDFVCFGPFEGETKKDVLTYFCANQDELVHNGPTLTYTNTLLQQMETEHGCIYSKEDANSPTVSDVNSDCFRGKYDEFPYGMMTDCSSSRYSTEVCYIPNGKSGQWYLLFITNWGEIPGTINFKKTSGSGTTHCDIIIDAYTTGPYCEGEDIQLGVYNAPAKATFLWTGPNGFTSTDKDPIIPNATKKNEGEYKVVMYNNGFESPEVSVQVDIFKKDTTTVKESVILEEDETFTFNGNEYDQSGSYPFLYENTNGCDSIVILDLTIKSPQDTIELMPIHPKDYFTPNSDGVADYWEIDNIGQYPDAKIRIFDRWGKLLFETKEYDNTTNAWDGTYKDTKCPSDDYWFVIDIESLDKQYKGHFSLIRGEKE